MAVPNIILPKPYILLTQQDSGLGLEFVNSNIVFGYVEKVYDTSDRVAVGQSAMFDITQAQKFIYGSTMYYMIKDEFVTGQEVLPP